MAARPWKRNSTRLGASLIIADCALSGFSIELAFRLVHAVVHAYGEVKFEDQTFLIALHLSEMMPGGTSSLEVCTTEQIVFELVAVI